MSYLTEEDKILEAEYKKLKDEFDNFHILDAVNPPDKISNEVISILLKSNASRFS